jgi:hypothetical protein
MFTLITHFDSFSSLNCAALGKTLFCPVRSIIRVGHWTKPGMGIKSLIFLRDSKSVCKKPTSSQIGGLSIFVLPIMCGGC